MMSKTKTTILGSAAACLSVVGLTADAGFAVNITSQDGRGDPNAPAATLADFQAFSDNAANLVAGDAVANLGGGGSPPGGVGAGYQALTGLEIGGFTISTSATGGGAPVGGNSFAAGSASHTDLNPVLDGFAFGLAGQTVTIAGLAAATNAGDVITLTAFGLGDNVGQDSDFAANYAGDTLTGSTAFNGGVAQSDATGSIPAVFFEFTADGTTDSISLDIVNSGQFNGFSVAVTPIPEPASMTLIGLGSLALIGRRRQA